ncbi:MAG: DNA mismatch repair endonuclease MutL [Desulfobacteraceae bacterium]
MTRIRVLPESVATRIAAGEVVERPASVVRELMDNSIDAGADRIEVTIEGGGRKLIRVSDNGLAMGRDDLLLSVERHATSKVRDMEDIFSVATLGFRGEALPSIASVSRMEITSRPREQVSGHRLIIKGGDLQSIDEVGAPPGTTVSVRDLFFNTPARRKFLRTARTEASHVMEVFSRIALPFNEVHFRLLDGDKAVLSYPDSDDRRERLSMLVGRDVADRMKEISAEWGSIAIRGYAAPPELSRSRGDRILVYVNGRSVRDRLVARAVMEAYGQRLMKGRYPQAILFLELPPSSVDINVHPAKQEVRFREAGTLYNALVSAVQGSLNQETLGRGIRYERTADPGSGWGEAPMGWEQTGIEEAPPQGGGRSLWQRDHQDHGGSTRPSLQVIGQLGGTYILCQSDEGLVLVDQHAAHERIVYEELRDRLSGAALEVHAFLIPKRFELSLQEAGLVARHSEALRRLGLELEPFGAGTVLLRSVPTQLMNVDLDRFIEELLPLLKEKGDDLGREEGFHELLTVMACHGAIRAGEPLSEQEMASLLQELQGTGLYTNCPHGRPIFKKFTWGELERMFKRIV